MYTIHLINGLVKTKTVLDEKHEIVKQQKHFQGTSILYRILICTEQLEVTL